MGLQQTFVQVRLPARNLVLGDVTRRTGSQADALVESVIRKSQDPAFRVWSFVKGLEADDLQDLAGRIEERYAVTPRLSKADSGHHVVFDVFPRDIQDRFWGALLAFQTSFGPPWLQFAGGEVTLRAQGTDCEPAECAARLERALSLARTEATVEIVNVPETQLAELRRLNDWRESEADTEPPAKPPGVGGVARPRPRRTSKDEA